VKCRHLIFWLESQRGSTAILQNWSQIGGLQSTGSPCKFEKGNHMAVTELIIIDYNIHACHHHKTPQMDNTVL
jgi:hypothetical protein